MGFWNGLGKMVQGKPVFGEGTQVPTGSNQSADKTPIDGYGNKIIPEVKFEHCKTHISGTAAEVTVWATNLSMHEIELDKVVMLDTKIEIDRRLGPQQSHEIKAYKGPIPTDDHSKKASLFYKLVDSGDYFRADFMIEYIRESDGTYFMVDFHPERQINDV